MTPNINTRGTNIGFEKVYSRFVPSLSPTPSTWDESGWHRFENRFPADQISHSQKYISVQILFWYTHLVEHLILHIEQQFFLFWTGFESNFRFSFDFPPNALSQESTIRPKTGPNRKNWCSICSLSRARRVDPDPIGSGSGSRSGSRSGSSSSSGSRSGSGSGSGSGSRSGSGPGSGSKNFNQSGPGPKKFNKPGPGPGSKKDGPDGL